MQMAVDYETENLQQLRMEFIWPYLARSAGNYWSGDGSSTEKCRFASSLFLFYSNVYSGQYFLATSMKEKRESDTEIFGSNNRKELCFNCIE